MCLLFEWPNPCSAESKPYEKSIFAKLLSRRKFAFFKDNKKNWTLINTHAYTQTYLQLKFKQIAPSKRFDIDITC